MEMEMDSEMGDGEGGFPLKKSPSQTFLPDKDDPMRMSTEDIGDTFMHVNKESSMDISQEKKQFEMLYQSQSTFSNSSIYTSSTSRPSSSPYLLQQQGKLFSPVTELLEAEKVLQRFKDEGVLPSKIPRTEKNETPLEKVVYSNNEVRAVAEGLISSMENDLGQFLKYRGILPSHFKETLEDVE